MGMIEFHYMFVAFSWSFDQAWHFKAQMDAKVNGDVDDDVLETAIDIFERSFPDSAMGYAVFDGKTKHLVCVTNGFMPLKAETMKS